MNKREHVKSGNALFLVIILTYLIINIGITVIAQMFHISFTYVQLILIAQIGYALPAIYYAVRKRQPLSNTIRLRKINFLTVLLLIIFAFSIMPLMNLLSMLSLLISKNYIQSTVTGMIDQTNFFVCFFAIGILPAILEEFVYRGVIYNEQRQGNVIKAILCSSLFFGLLHMNINQFSYAFVMGIVLAVTVEATGTIAGSMIVHATINGYSVIIAKLQPLLTQNQSVDAAKGLSRADILKLLPAYVGISAVATAFAGFLLFLIVKYNNRDREIKAIFLRDGENTVKQKVSFVDVYFVFAVMIAVGLMISREMAG